MAMELQLDKAFIILREELSKMFVYMAEKLLGEEIQDLEVQREDSSVEESKKYLWVTWILFLTAISLVIHLVRQKGFIPKYDLSESLIDEEEEAAQEMESFAKELAKRDKMLECTHHTDSSSKNSCFRRNVKGRGMTGTTTNISNNLTDTHVEINNKNNNSNTNNNATLQHRFHSEKSMSNNYAKSLEEKFRNHNFNHDSNDVVGAGELNYFEQLHLPTQRIKKKLGVCVLSELETDKGNKTIKLANSP